MPYTVTYSFDVFRSEKVDLASDQVKQARKSRDYLIEQIQTIEKNDGSFPRLYGGYKPFGSFARSTKVRPLNDIDLLLLLNGKGTASHFYSGYTYWLRVDTVTPSLKPYLDDHGFLNSTKVLNKFKSSLASVPNYKRADIKRNGVAVCLSLSSYDWVFDIVPAFPISDGMGGTGYYLIPDGSGEWKRTDPRKDEELVTAANKQHDKLLLPLIRLIKYWNTYRYSPPEIPSYYLETMLITGMRYSPAITSIIAGLPKAFSTLSSSVIASCPDPKGLGSDLSDGVNWDTRWKVHTTAKEMAQYADEALQYERLDDHKKAIEYWSKIFPSFPSYG